jgi:hypothetical protein
MRIPSAVSLPLIIVSVAVSAMLWHQLRTERQLRADLQTQLSDAKTALATRPQPQPVIAAVSQPAAATPAAACPPTTPDKSTVAAATATVMAESGKRQKALLENAEFRKARIAQLRGNLQLQPRFANLARDVGLSAQEADAVFTILAESQLRQESMLAETMAGGVTPDSAQAAELTRAMQDLDKQQKDAMVALLGPERAGEVQDYGEVAQSRQRVSNITNMLTQAGKPLTAAQSKSLTAALVVEQRRQESEAKTLGASGQTQQSQTDRAIEGDRRVLAAAASFLDAQQVELIRARFEQVRTRNRAATQQQRAAEAVEQGEGK